MMNKTTDKTNKSSASTRKRHKGLLIAAVTMLAIVIAVIVTIFVVKPFGMTKQSGDTNTAINTTSNGSNGGDTNANAATDQNGNTSTASTTISKEATTNTVSVSTTTVTNNDVNTDVTTTDTTGDADLDTKIAKAITLLSSCAGNNDTPDEQAGNDAGLTTKSYFESFASKPDETYTPEDMPSNSDNLVELYRMSEHASILYPKLSARMIRQIDFISEGQEDDAKTYTVRVSCTDTYKNEFGGKKDVPTLRMDTILINPDDGTILSVREREL